MELMHAASLYRHVLPGPTLNRGVIAGLHAALDAAEADPAVRLFVIEGGAGVFCTGMDFEEASTSTIGSAADARAPVERLYALFERFTASSRIVLALVDGRVTAGGVGLQDAYRMSLTAERIDAQQALASRLVDEVTDTPADSLRRLLIRVGRVAPADVAAAKAFFRQLWIMDATTKHTAIEAITARITDPAVMAGIRGFVQDGGLPWRKPSG